MGVGLPLSGTARRRTPPRPRRLSAGASAARLRPCVHESRSPVGAIGPRPQAHRPRRIPMALTAAELVKSDHEHLIHPLHHPVDTAEPMIYVRGRGATLTDIGGKEYIDGLAGLWNVNVGHGRAELAEAAADQIKELAYYSGYAGFSSVPAVNLASKLVGLGYPNMQGVFFKFGGGEANESATRTG